MISIPKLFSAPVKPLQSKACKPDFGCRNVELVQSKFSRSKQSLRRSGRLTRAAILLFGKREIGIFFKTESSARINVETCGAEEQAYEHFGPPFFLNSSLLYQRIRNIQMRLLPADELIPYEIAKYDQKVFWKRCIIVLPTKTTLAMGELL